MKRICCRSTPRCAGCPVLVKHRMPPERDTAAVARLVHEIFAGVPRSELPPGVAAALERLDAARREAALPRAAGPGR